jgi:molybdopterin biosynthesis enzyme MoaB
MPEATAKVCHRMANGIAEAIRSNSLQITPRGMLSRGVAGIRNQTLIVNLPGSPKAVRESLDYILDSIHHGLEILKGETSECGS